jgi:hypothetical protein
MMLKYFLSLLGIWRLKYLISTVLVVFSSGVTTIVQAANPDAHLKGEFGPLHNWPIIPIAAMLMPDGRIFAYGTDTAGVQNGKLHYSIWDPSLGTGSSAFETLPNTTHTDIFCAAQAMIPATGQALILGGDALVNNKRNYANSDVNIFDPTTDTLIRQSQNMAFKRWYATAVTMPNGEHVVLGGRNDRFFAGTATIPATENTYSPIPEVRSVAGNWRTLTTASSETAYGSLGGMSWYYPRAWVNPQGKIFILNHNGQMFQLDISGTGTLTKYVKRTVASRTYYPSVMFAPGKILSVRNSRAAVTVDFNGTGEPVVSSAGSLVKDHQYGSATVLADGQVWVSGGSSTGNTLAGMVLESELWNPATNTWTTAASAVTARLYHSASLLLPDGSVFTGGGGAPGPLNQRNGEIYYPPYLFKTDGSGEFAPRPEIIDAPTTMIGWNQEFSIEANTNIAKVTLMRIGAATHTFDHEARFFNLAIPQSGNIVTVKTPATANIAPPGFYMIFVWDNSGVPSIARIIQIG